MKNTHKLLLCFSLQISLILSAPLELDMKIKSVNTSQSNDATPFQNNKTCLLGNLKQEVLTLQTCIGDQDQCFNLVYDTASFHLLVPSKNQTSCFGCEIYEKLKSKINKEYEHSHAWLNYTLGLAVGHSETDNIKMGNSFEDINMNFMINDKMEYGVIGFGRECVTEGKSHMHTFKNNSIMNVLRESGVINRKVFSQKFTNEEKTEGKLYIGDMHEDFVNKTNVSSCGVVTKDSWLAKDKFADKWNCRLSHVILGDNKAKNFNINAIPINSRAVFDSRTNYILAPQSEIGPFKNYFEERNCTEKKDPAEGVTIFLCEDPLTNNDNDRDFSFVFNGTAFHIPPSEMFQPALNLAAGSVASIMFMRNLDHWVLGLNFMKNLHILFDAENDLVAFKPLDVRHVSDVSSMTTDADFVMCDYYEYILFFMLVLVVVMFTALIMFLLRLRKSRVEGKSNKSDNAIYALLDTQKSINQI